MFNGRIEWAEEKSHGIPTPVDEKKNDEMKKIYRIICQDWFDPRENAIPTVQLSA